MSRREAYAFTFAAGEGRFEGRLAGALERAESGGAIRVRDVLVVGREPGSGELRVLRAQGATGGMLAKLTDFRMGVGAAGRTAVTPGLERIGAALAPGEVVVGVVVEHLWADVLERAAEHSGGHPAGGPLALGPDDDLADVVMAVL